MRFLLYKKIGVIIMLLIILFSLSRRDNYNDKKFLGGYLMFREEVFDGTLNEGEHDYNERYQRPSQQKALPNKYSLDIFMNGSARITSSEDVVYAYYGLLKEASNMMGYSGGCGTIGNANTPYQYAYELLAKDTRQRITRQQFEDSFKGIGHITFLKMYELSKNSNESINYFIEIEVITGKAVTNNIDYEDAISYFAYYYGVVTTIREDNAWKIKEIKYYNEEFLCAPYHNWFYDASSVVGIVYIDNLKVIDKIDGITNNNDVIYVYATGRGNKYRFDFIRLTNGHDILVRENIMKSGIYHDTEVLDSNWDYLKFKSR